MGKKNKKNRQTPKVPVETAEQVDRPMEMPPDFPGQVNFKALKGYAMAVLSAIRILSPQEREKEMVKEEEKKKITENKKNKKKSEKVEVPLESQEKVEHIPDHEIHEAPVECEMDARRAILRAPSQEEKEKVKHEKENATEYTEEEIYEMLKQCNMDPDLAIQRLLSLEGFEKVKSKRTKKKERFNAQESKSQYEVGSSSGSSVLKQGESVDDDAGRTDTTHDNTVQGLQEADSNPRSQLDNVSSPLAATVSSVASQLPSSNRGKGKGKKIVRSSGDDTSVKSRSRDPPLLPTGPQRIHASRAGSNPGSSRKNVAGSSRNDFRKFPTTLGSSLTTRNGEFSGERSIRDLRTYATVLMPSDPEEQLNPHTRACEAPADALNPNSGGSGTLECELMPTSNEPRIRAEESTTQHKVGSSMSSIVKQGENCDDDAGRTDTTHDSTVHGLQDAGSDRISQLDNVSTPSATALSSVASQLHGPTVGIGKRREVVQSMDNTAVISRSHISPLPARGTPIRHASRAGSDQRASRNSSYSGNVSVMLPTALGGSSTTGNGTRNEFSGERSISGPSTHVTLPMPLELENKEIPNMDAREAPADARNYNPGSSVTLERKLLPKLSEQSGPSEDSPSNSAPPFSYPSTEPEHHRSPTLDDPPAPPRMSEIGPSEDTPINSATYFNHLLREPEGLRSPTLDAPPAPSRMSEHALPEAGPTLRCSVESIQNDSPDLPPSPFHQIDPLMYSSMMRSAMMSVNAPPFAPSSSIHQSSQTLLRGNNLSTGRGFAHPYMEPYYYQPQLALQNNYMNHDGQQDVYQGGILSLANAGPNSWERFPGTRGTLPNSPALSDTSWTQQASALHLQAQNRYYSPYGMNFTARYNQPDPRAMSTLPRQQQGGLLGWVPPPSDLNNQHDMPSAQQEMYQGGSSSWVSGNASGWGTFQDTGRTCYRSPLIPPYSPAPFSIPRTSNGFTVHAQDQYRIDQSPLIIPGAAMTPHGSFARLALLPANANNWRGEGSSLVNGNASDWGSFQSPPIPPYSPAPPNDHWTSNESTLHAHYQYRNVHRPLISPGLATTPHGSFPRMTLLPANANNQHRSEGSSIQYDSQGWLSQQYPQTRNRPDHQQQSPYNKPTGNLQDPSSMQPPRDPGSSG